MINLTIKFSSEYEVERIKWTLGDLQWYEDNGYGPKFPKNLKISPGANISEYQIKESVNSEYSEDDFKIQERYLLDNWHRVIDEASAELEKTSLRSVDMYTVYLTKYGVGGSYNYPHSVVVNIKSKYEKGLLRTVFHEIIHLMIHPWIIEHKVSHWQKERIVDLLTTKFVPQISRAQEIRANIIEPVDRIFNEHYPNIELVIKNVGRHLAIPDKLCYKIKQIR